MSESVSPFPFVFRSVFPCHVSFSVLQVVSPFPLIHGSSCPDIFPQSVPFASAPRTRIFVSVEVVHHTFTLLHVLHPRTLVHVVVRKVVSALSLLHVLAPFSYIPFADVQHHRALTVSFSLGIFTLVHVAVRIHCPSHSVRFPSFQLSGIFRTVLKLIVSHGQLCFRHSARHHHTHSQPVYSQIHNPSFLLKIKHCPPLSRPFRSSPDTFPPAP